MAVETVPPPASAVVPPVETPPVHGVTRLFVGVVAVAALYLGHDVFVPIVIAVLLSFVLAPFVEFLRRIGLGRVPSVLIAVLVALGIIIGLASIIGTQIASLATDLPQYEATIADKFAKVRNATLGRVSEAIAHFGRRLEQATEPAQPTAPTARARQNEAEKPIPVQIREPDPSPFQLVRTYLGHVLAPLETALIVLVVVVFILMQRQDLRDRMIRLFGSTDLHRTTAAMNEAAGRLSRFFLTQVCLNAAFGVVIAAGLWLIGVPSPILWGILAGLMRFVPYFGALISGVLPVALAAAVDPGWSMALMVVALFLISEPLMGQAVEPLVYGHSTGLSPFAVVVSALFWTWLWGPIGLILSTPLTLCLVVLGRHVEPFEFFDVLLGNRPALTPVENFYQRVLAGDADEVQESAEELLKTRALSSYYDEVALKGLQLAIEDAGRGVLTGGQLDRIRGTIAELVDGLDPYEDQEPAPAKATEADESPAGLSLSERVLPQEPALAEVASPPQDRPPGWRSETPILCIVGRGVLDEAPSSMLAQLLRKHGLGARVVAHSAASRSNLAGLDVSGIAMICICYLEITGAPAHLRYLIRRLRARAPGTKILVGFWAADDEVFSAERMREVISADVYVSSLRDAVAACLSAAREVENDTARGHLVELKTKRPPQAVA